MMSVLSGKKILLGITGGIAAYKSAFLVRLLVKAKAEVRVIMTPEAGDFVTALTLSTLSKNPVFSEFIEQEHEVWNNHVEFAKWADLMCIAPATANTISKMVNGQSDNLLLATYLSTDCPVYVASAMDVDMYQHRTTKINFEKLKSFGHKIIPSEAGELASGLIGKGRMAEPENICNFIEKEIKKGLPLANKKVLITAGPTYEAIDPVRFIGNHSSGKMGFALAEVAAKNGAEVILVTGPSSLKTDLSNINTLRVTDTEEMYNVVHQYYEKMDIVIAAAAVSDYKPQNVASQKIKKNDKVLTLTLEKTKDILFSLGKKKQNQVLVGFALETENELKNAKNKLLKKNLDFIILNSLREEGAGFGTETNKIKIISSKGEVKTFNLKSKTEVAKDIITEINTLIKSKDRCTKNKKK